MPDHWVYKAYDAEGSLLYVGYTGVGRSRPLRHQRTVWGPRVARFDIEHFDNQFDALDRERQLIQDENPEANITYKARELTYPPPPEGRWSVKRVAEWLHLTNNTIVNAIKRGDIEAEPNGPTWAIDPQSVLRWLEKCKEAT